MKIETLKMKFSTGKRIRHDISVFISFFRSSSDEFDWKSIFGDKLNKTKFVTSKTFQFQTNFRCCRVKKLIGHFRFVVVRLRRNKIVLYFLAKLIYLQMSRAKIIVESNKNVETINFTQFPSSFDSQVLFAWSVSDATKSAASVAGTKRCRNIGTCGLCYACKCGFRSRRWRWRWIMATTARRNPSSYRPEREISRRKSFVFLIVLPP